MEVELEYTPLDVSGENYFSWIVDAKLHLAANNLEETIEEGNTASSQDRAKAWWFLRRHLHEDLKFECLMVKDPLELWKLLKERYECLKQVFLLKARNKWNQLRFQDFESVSEYNSTLFRIRSELMSYGENVNDDDMLEKTFSTFHVSNMLLQQLYRLRGFKKYYELIPCLLVAEQNNELVMKNHQSRPTTYVAFPEVNVTSFAHKRPHKSFRRLHKSSYIYKRGVCGRGRGREHGHNNI